MQVPSAAHFCTVCQQYWTSAGCDSDCRDGVLTCAICSGEIDNSIVYYNLDTVELGVVGPRKDGWY